jgi:hypothetical protein
MSTKRSVGRLTATNKKDRSGLCAFTFADGRQCRTPRRSGHQHLCCFHAQKEAQARAARQAGASSVDSKWGYEKQGDGGGGTNLALLSPTE